MRTTSRRRTSSPRVTAALTTAATVLALGACGGSGSSGTGSEAGSSAPGAPTSSAPPADPRPSGTDRSGGTDAATPSTAPAVPEILDFEAVAVDGAGFSGADVAGRPVVVWFWAPWCAVCRSQVPEVEALVAEHGDEVAFLGVGSLDGEEAIAAFAEDVPGITHLSDPDGELYQRFGIAEQSSFVVLDAEGGEVLRTGYGDDDELAGVVDDLAS